MLIGIQVKKRKDWEGKEREVKGKDYLTIEHTYPDLDPNEEQIVTVKIGSTGDEVDISLEELEATVRVLRENVNV